MTGDGDSLTSNASPHRAVGSSGRRSEYECEEAVEAELIDRTCRMVRLSCAYYTSVSPDEEPSVKKVRRVFAALEDLLTRSSHILAHPGCRQTAQYATWGFLTLDRQYIIGRGYL